MSLRHAFPHCLRVSLTLLLLLATITTARSVCKAVLGSSSWPDSAAWASLNETVGGRLLSVVPPGAVCHASQPSFNEAACKEVASKWPDEFFHAADPVSVEWNNFNNDSCLPEPADAATGWGCSGAGYPVYVINATEAAHVKAGVDFGELLVHVQSV